VSTPNANAPVVSGQGLFRGRNKVGLEENNRLVYSLALSKPNRLAGETDKNSTQYLSLELNWTINIGIFRDFTRIQSCLIIYFTYS
jgi:hypothetical protein